MIEYKYNAEGLREGKVGADGSEVRYLMDGLAVLCEYEGGLNILREYVPGISIKQNNQTYYYITDRLGNVRYVLDETGAIVNSYLYSPFGQIHSSSGSLSQPYQYIGGEFYYTEEDINLQLLGQRWYDGQTGRFISRDPIGEEGGLNLYVYVGNKSQNLIDPNGLFCMPISTGSAKSFFGNIRIIWIEGLSPRLDMEILSVSIPGPGGIQISLGNCVICHWFVKIRRRGFLIKSRVTEWLCWEKCKGWYKKITTHQETIPINDERWEHKDTSCIHIPVGMSAEEICKINLPSLIKNAEGIE